MNDFKEFFKEHGDLIVAHGLTGTVTIEDLYSMFKARLLHEIHAVNIEEVSRNEFKTTISILENKKSETSQINEQRKTKKCRRLEKSFNSGR